MGICTGWLNRAQSEISAKIYAAPQKSSSHAISTTRPNLPALGYSLLKPQILFRLKLLQNPPRRMLIFSLP